MITDMVHVGDKYGRWTVLEDPKKINGMYKCKCQCECGTIRSVYAYDLKKGKSLSCGCLPIEMMTKANTKHGHWGEPLYIVWKGMRGRCYTKGNKEYKNYGARGIRVCDEWNDYEVFREWAIENGYKKGLSIDRINYNGNYEPGNCRWATAFVQNNNSRHNKRVVIDGVEMNLCEAERLYGISKATVYNRLKYGWDIIRAITQPVDKNKVAKRYRHG